MGPKRLADGFMRVGPLMGLPALVRQFGCDAGTVFSDSGFKLAQFANPDYEIPYVAASKLFARCVAETECQHLGLLLGERTAPSSLGIPGFLVQSAPDVGAALRDLLRNLSLHDRGAVASMVTTDGVTIFDYAICLPGVAATDHICDLSMTVVCRIMRGLCGESWTPTEVLLSHPPPRDVAPYRRFFRAPLRFDAEQSALVFHASWLDHPVPGADALLHDYMEKKASEIHCLHETDFVVHFRQLLRESLLAHRCVVADVSSQLGIHERTLNRRLSKEGTSFRQEIENIRYEIARQLLANTQMQVSQIALTLDYSGDTAFSRAFKQWSGVSPTEWRVQHRAS